MTRLRLAEIAHARSGDKGDRADIGLFAWDEAGYALLAVTVTRERVAAHFAHLMKHPGEAAVDRHELPQLQALKFVLHGALDGGAARSLRSDNLGKTIAAQLLRMTVEVPDGVAQAALEGARRALAAYGVLNPPAPPRSDPAAR
jgi:hypothetical protein